MTPQREAFATLLAKAPRRPTPIAAARWRLEDAHINRAKLVIADFSSTDGLVLQLPLE